VKPATLILFVDALPFDDLEQLPKLNAWPWKARLKPGFGYSINLHPELFSGLSPDEVGFFGEWTVDPSRAPGRRYRALLPLLDTLCRSYLMNRGLQHILTKRYRPERIMPNLPLKRLGDFAIHGEKVGDPAYGQPSIFSDHPGLERVSMEGLDKGARDAAVVDRAAEAIKRGALQLYVPLIDLDGIGHSHRRESDEWRAHLANLDEWIEILSAGFLTLHPEGQVFVLSDHGMTDVHGGVKFEIEAAVGPAGPDTYLYFTDSTLLRIWVYDETLGEAIFDFLDASEVSTLIMQDEREAYGIANPAFGDFIAVLDEGLCFKPSTFARNIPAAMHGYHPEVYSQHAILAVRRAEGMPPVEEIDRTLKVHALLDAALSGEPG
jgi:hypothetical protein